ncbi:MAG: sulfurtransferase TusA family protein, partial [Anaerolineae bacterium]|nr:sulfurtransferase TusA family protein [Anaerolineae bacterium]
MESDRVEDFRGQLCPMPIVNMARMIKKMEAGQMLEIWADDEGAHADVPAWCDQTGNEFLGEEEAGDYTRYFVKKTG